MLIDICIGGVMVFNTTFNSISVISWWSVLLVEETGVPEVNHQPPQFTDKLDHIKLHQVLIMHSIIKGPII
jgi:hypothetical protein